jgi:hypothetical protein
MKVSFTATSRHSMQYARPMIHDVLNYLSINFIIKPEEMD